MNSYTATFEFGSEADESEANAWFNTLMEALPAGATGKLVHHPFVLAVEELEDEHLGTTINVYIPGEGQVTGTLDAVYPAAGGVGRTLIIDGIAHTVTFGVAQISAW